MTGNDILEAMNRYQAAVNALEIQKQEADHFKERLQNCYAKIEEIRVRKNAAYAILQNALTPEALELLKDCQPNLF